MVFRNWLQGLKKRLVNGSRRGKCRKRIKAGRSTLRSTQPLEMRTPPGDITGVSAIFVPDFGHLPNLAIVMTFMSPTGEGMSLPKGSCTEKRFPRLLRSSA